MIKIEKEVEIINRVLDIKDWGSIDGHVDDRMVNKPFPEDEERVEINLVEKGFDGIDKKISLSIPKKVYEEIREDDSNFKKRGKIFWKQVKLNSLKGKLKEKKMELNHFVLYSKVDEFSQKIIKAKILDNNSDRIDVSNDLMGIDLHNGLIKYLSFADKLQKKEKTGFIENVKRFIDFIKTILKKKKEIEERIGDKVSEEAIPLMDDERQSDFKEINIGGEEYKNPSDIEEEISKYKGIFSPKEFKNMGDILKTLDKSISRIKRETEEVESMIINQKEIYMDYEQNQEFWQQTLEIVAGELLKDD